jgi:hypothetical protein
MRRVRLAGLAAATALLLTASAVLAGGPTLGWSDLHDGGANLVDDGFVALTDPDGNAIVGGVHTTPDGFNDIFVRKLARESGLAAWTFVHAADGDNDMAVADMVIDHRGDIMVAGYLSSCDS